MKKTGKYLINPVPFVMTVANPGGKKRGRKAKRRNPAASKKSPGIFVIRKAKRNPVKAPPMKSTRRKARRKSARRNPPMGAGVAGGGPIRRKVGAKAWHHKRGTYVYNPLRKAAKRRKARRNPAKSPFYSSIKTMSKKTRRRGSRRRTRNPISRGARRRSGRRSSARRFRNPIPIVSELFGPDMLSLAGGIVISNVGTTMIMNRLLTANPTTGARPVNLPGVDYSALANPATAANFYKDNAWALALYKLGMGAGAGWLLRNQSPRLSKGMLIGSVATAISDVLRNTGVLSPTGTIRGMGRNFPAGMGYLPGTNTRFTNPGQQFLATGVNNVPRPRGMGAAVGTNMLANTQGQVEGAFRGAN